MRLAGARVVVTGASRGIGAALATRVTERGARVALVARSEDAIGKLAAQLGGDAYPADLADADAVDGLIARIEADGPVDVLVNNAGLDLAGDLTVLSPAAIRELLAVNLLAPVLLSRAAIPGMIRRGSGHIVNVSSLASTNAVAGLAPYSTSKAGLSHFTAALRAELKGTGVGTTLVEIGPVGTGMLDSVRAYGPTDRAFARLGRLGLLPTLDLDAVVRDIVEAIERGRRHVRLPRRDALFPMLVEVPRRVTEVLVAGLPPRADTEPQS
jgi:uncharacterized protein